MPPRAQWRRTGIDNAAAGHEPAALPPHAGNASPERWYRNRPMWQALRGITLLAKRSYHRHSSDRTRLPLRHRLGFGSGPQKPACLKASDSGFRFAANPQRHDPRKRLAAFGQQHFFAFAHGLHELREMLIRFLQSNFHFAQPAAPVVTSLL